jgi:uncharacterized protein involved in exopolysaccharide biosynthesis
MVRLSELLQYQYRIITSKVLARRAIEKLELQEVQPFKGLASWRSSSSPASKWCWPDTASR